MQISITQMPIRLLAFLVLTWTITGCSLSNESKKLEVWTGEYGYEEESIKAIAGYSMVMIWELSINKSGDSCQGILEVNGQQTYIKLLTTITGDTNTIAITYNRLIDGSSENLQKGDTLFTLSKNGHNLKTKWFALEPRLAENPVRECNCFVREK